MSVATEKEREMVLAITGSSVADLFGDTWPWLPIADEGVVDEWLAKATVAFLPRSIAESADSWRHFCTYSILRDGDRYFTYRRGSSGSEGRLHGKLSLGVGGHVGIEDYEAGVGVCAEMLAATGFRELREEMENAGYRGLYLAGLIADDSTPVNRVHLGLVYLVDSNSSRAHPREACLADPVWLTAAELHERRSEFETWSQIVIDRLIGGGA